MDALFEKTNELSFRYAFQNGIIKPDEIIDMADRYVGGIETWENELLRYNGDFVKAIEVMMLGSVHDLTDEQRQAFIEFGSAAIGRNFINEFEELGFIPQGGKKFKDMPILELLERGISQGIIPLEKVIKVLSEEKNANLREILNREELRKNIMQLKKRIEDHGLNSDDVVEELMNNRYVFLRGLSSSLEDLGIVNQVLFAQTEVNSTEEFNEMDIAMRKIDKATLLQLIK